MIKIITLIVLVLASPIASAMLNPSSPMGMVIYSSVIDDDPPKEHKTLTCTKVNKDDYKCVEIKEESQKESNNLTYAKIVVFILFMALTIYIISKR